MFIIMVLDAQVMSSVGSARHLSIDVLKPVHIILLFFIIHVYSTNFTSPGVS